MKSTRSEIDRAADAVSREADRYAMWEVWRQLMLFEPGGTEMDKHIDGGRSGDESRKRSPRKMPQEQKTHLDLYLNGLNTEDYTVDELCGKSAVHIAESLQLKKLPPVSPSTVKASLKTLHKQAKATPRTRTTGGRDRNKSLSSLLMYVVEELEASFDSSLISNELRFILSAYRSGRYPEAYEALDQYRTERGRKSGPQT